MRGLSVSTILTVFLIPLLYVMLEERFPRTMRDEGAEEASGSTTTQPSLPTATVPTPAPQA